jgi:hypothetical protein
MRKSARNLLAEFRPKTGMDSGRIPGGILPKYANGFWAEMTDVGYMDGIHSRADNIYAV